MYDEDGSYHVDNDDDDSHRMDSMSSYSPFDYDPFESYDWEC